VDQNCYIDLLKTSLLPECLIHFVFIQDSAPSHRAKATQQFLWQNTPDFIAAVEWTSYSPDLNPLDYYIWDILQDLVYEGRRLHVANLQNLKEAIKTSGRRSPLRQFENSLHYGNKNLAIANRSRVSCINTNNNTITLKSGFEVTQGHWKWYYLKAWVRFPIRLL